MYHSDDNNNWYLYWLLYFALVVALMASSCKSKQVIVAPETTTTITETITQRDTVVPVQLEKSSISERISPQIISGKIDFKTRTLVGKYSTATISALEGDILVELESLDSTIDVTINNAITERMRTVETDSTLVVEVNRLTWWQETTSKVGNWTLIIIGAFLVLVVLKILLKINIPFL